MDFITKNIQDNKNKPNFIDQIKDFFASLQSNHLGANNFKEEKESIKNYQEIMASERLKRKKTDPLDMYNDDAGSKGENISQKIDFNEDLKPIKQPEKTVPPVVETQKVDIESIKNKFAKSWEAPKILKTNLVKGENTTFINWHKNLNLLFWTCLSAVFLLVVVYGGLVYWEMTAQKQKMKLDSEIEAVKAQVLSEAGTVEKIDIFQEKLKYAAWLLEKHVYFTNFFKFLENNLLPEVYLSSDFTGKADGQYSFTAETDNFKTLSSQLLLLKSQKEVLSAKIEGGNFSSDKTEQTGKEVLNFNLVLNLKPELFFKGSSTKLTE